MAYQARVSEWQNNTVRRPYEQPVEVPSFEVVPGRGIDARVREGVSSSFVVLVAKVVQIFALLVVCGVVSVALISATVSSLRSSQSLRTEVREAQASFDDLQAQHSTLSSSSRITRIATQNYGMVAASTTEVIPAAHVDSSQAAPSAQ